MRLRQKNAPPIKNDRNVNKGFGEIKEFCWKLVVNLLDFHFFPQKNMKLSSLLDVDKSKNFGGSLWQWSVGVSVCHPLSLIYNFEYL